LLLSVASGWDYLLGSNSAMRPAASEAAISAESIMPDELRVQVEREYAAPGGTSGLAARVSFDTLPNGMPILHSRPGAAGAVFLDFDGNTAGPTDPYSEDSDSTTFNAAEQASIAECWRQMAIYYAMFDLDVTTIQPDVSTVSTAWGAIGNNVGRGHSGVNVYPNRTNAKSFNDDSNARTRVSGIAHEIGHNFGDRHQSTYDAFGLKTAEYAGATDALHGPLMGVDYAGVIHKWSIGHPGSSPSNLQDDMAKIATKIVQYAPAGYTGDGYAPDDFAGTLAAAMPLTVSGTSQSVVGIIERLSDADAFSFVSSGGSYAMIAGRDRPSGVDLKLAVYDSAGNLLAAEDGDPRAVPLTMVNDQSITMDLPAGTYYAMVESHGNYGDVGQYVLKVDPLPAGWTSQDVGTVGIPGCTTFDAGSGTFTVAGSGTDISSTTDRFQFAYQTLKGDGTIIARVTNIDNTASGAKSGVMIRESLAADSRLAAMMLSYGNGARWMRRTTTGGSLSNTGSGSGTYTPTWLKLQRIGNSYTGYKSSDGTTWTQVGSTQTIAMGETVYVGLATTAANNTKINWATLTNVSITGTLNPGPPLNALPAPDGLTVSSATSSSIDLSFNAVPGATGYLVEQSSDGANFAQAGTVPAGITTYISSSLADAQRYFFRVRAQDAVGVSPASMVVSGQTRAGAVSALSAVPWTTTSLILNWHDASGETGYRVERSSDGSTWTALSTVGANIPSYTATGLAQGTQYWFRVVTLDGSGDAATSSALVAATRWSGLVTGLTFTAVQADQISFTWNEVGGEDSYLVERGTTPTALSTIATLPAGTTSYTDLGRTPLTEYYYRVTPLKQLADTTSYGQFHSAFYAATKATTTLPEPWQSQDIGPVGGPGTAGYASPTFTVIGAGAGISGSSDQFHFLYRTINGDGSILAHNVSQDGNDDVPSRAGVMIRESLAANAKYVAGLNYWGSNGATPRMQSRAATGGSTSTISFPLGVTYKWFRVTRTGDTFTAGGSNDGTAWTSLGSVTIAMGTTVYVGMIVSAGTNTQMSKCTFDNVTVAFTNHAPTDLSLSSSSVLENQPVGTVVGTFSTTDPDLPGDVFTYSLVDTTTYPDNAAFAVVGNQLTTTVGLDYETKNSYSIRVRSTDQGSSWYEKVLTINVTDAPPTAHTWAGGGSNATWTTGANWVAGALDPLDTPVFPAAAPQTTNTNSFPAGTTFGSLTFSGSGYDISGNSIVLSGGITNSIPTGQSNHLALDVQFASATTSVVTDGGTLTLSGGISANGTVTKTGTGTLIISGPQTWGSGSVFQVGGTGEAGAEGQSQSAGSVTVEKVDAGTSLGSASAAGNDSLAGAPGGAINELSPPALAVPPVRADDHDGAKSLGAVSGSALHVLSPHGLQWAAAHDAILAAGYPLGAADRSASTMTLADELGWMYAYENTMARKKKESSDHGNSTEKPLDAVLATYWS